MNDKMTSTKFFVIIKSCKILQKNVYYNYILNLAVSFIVFSQSIFIRSLFDSYYYIYVILKEAASENLVIYSRTHTIEI